MVNESVVRGPPPRPLRVGFFTAGPGKTFAFLCPRASVPPLLEPESMLPRWSRDFWDTSLVVVPIFTHLDKGLSVSREYFKLRLLFFSSLIFRLISTCIATKNKTQAPHHGEIPSEAIFRRSSSGLLKNRRRENPKLQIDLTFPISPDTRFGKPRSVLR